MSESISQIIQVVIWIPAFAGTTNERGFYIALINGFSLRSSPGQVLDPSSAPRGGEFNP